MCFFFFAWYCTVRCFRNPNQPLGIYLKTLFSSGIFTIYQTGNRRISEPSSTWQDGVATWEKVDEDCVCAAAFRGCWLHRSRKRSGQQKSDQLMVGKFNHADFCLRRLCSTMLFFKYLKVGQLFFVFF